MTLEDHERIQELLAGHILHALDEEEARLEALFKAQGHRSGHAGVSFEETALARYDSVPMHPMAAAHL